MVSAGSSPGGRSVLLVEDAPFSSEITRLVLEAAGHRVEVAETGLEAVERVRGRHFDLVLMDLDLPQMDGFAAHAAIRSLGARQREIPVAALTAARSDDDVKRCFKTGMIGHTAKPFVPAHLLRDVERWARPGQEADVAPAQVWLESIYRELVERLGSARMDRALDDFQGALVEANDAIRDAPDDRDLLDRKVHGLASTGGMLGFIALLEACRRIMGAGPEASWSVLVEDFESASGHVLTCLRTRRRQAT